MAKKVCVSLILALVAFSAVLGQEPNATDAAPWESFSSSQGRFTVVVPTKPTAVNRELDSRAGKLILYSYMSGNRVGLFIGTFGDYPSEPDDSAQAERILDSVRNGVISVSGAKLISEKKVWIKGHPGRELAGSARVEDMQVVYTWRIFLVDRRLYQLTAATLVTNANHPDVAKFLNSFDLIPQ